MQDIDIFLSFLTVWFLISIGSYQLESQIIFIKYDNSFFVFMFLKVDSISLQFSSEKQSGDKLRWIYSSVLLTLSTNTNFQPDDWRFSDLQYQHNHPNSRYLKHIRVLISSCACLIRGNSPVLSYRRLKSDDFPEFVTKIKLLFQIRFLVIFANSIVFVAFLTTPFKDFSTSFKLNVSFSSENSIAASSKAMLSNKDSPSPKIFSDSPKDLVAIIL